MAQILGTKIINARFTNSSNPRFKSLEGIDGRLVLAGKDSCFKCEYGVLKFHMRDHDAYCVGGKIISVKVYTTTSCYSFDAI